MAAKTWEQREVCEILDVKPSTLRYWAGRKIFSPAEDAVGKPGIRRKYNRKNLLEVAVLRELHNQGIPLDLTNKKSHLAGLQIRGIRLIGDRRRHSADLATILLLKPSPILGTNNVTVPLPVREPVDEIGVLRIGAAGLHLGAAMVLRSSPRPCRPCLSLMQEQQESDIAN